MLEADEAAEEAACFQEEALLLFDFDILTGRAPIHLLSQNGEIQALKAALEVCLNLFLIKYFFIFLSSFSLKHILQLGIRGCWWLFGIFRSNRSCWSNIFTISCTWWAKSCCCFITV